MQAQQRTIIEDYIKGYNQMDIDLMLLHLHPKIVFENISGDQVTLATNGLDAFRQQATTALGYFKQREQKVTNWFFGENFVSIDIDYNATLAVDFPNGMKAGEVLSLKGKSNFYFEKDKIAKIQDRS